MGTFLLFDTLLLPPRLWGSRLHSEQTIDYRDTHIFANLPRFPLSPCLIRVARHFLYDTGIGGMTLKEHNRASVVDFYLRRNGACYNKIRCLHYYIFNHAKDEVLFIIKF